MLIVNAACTTFDATGCTKFTDLMTDFLLPTLQAIVIVVAVIYLLYGAIQYITSAGEEKQAKQATTTLTNAVIGLIIALLIVVFLNVIKSIVGVTGETAGSGFDTFVPGAN